MSAAPSRRQFLKGAGGFALALPLLPSLLPATARAQSAPIKRFVSVVSLYGQFDRNFYPAQTPTTRVADDISWGRLTSTAGNISSVLNDPFTALKAKMAILRGLDNTGGGGHNAGIPLTGSSMVAEDGPPRYGKSIDVVMQTSPAVYATPPRHRALRVSANSSGFSWDRVNGSAVQLPHVDNDRALFDMLFGETPPSETEATALRNRKVFLADRVLQDYHRLRANPRLAGEDKLRVDHHVATLDDLQRKLEGSRVTSCEIEAQAPYDQEAHVRDKLYENYIDSIVLAFACDLTRVVAMYIPDFTNNRSLNGSHFHENSHDSESGAGNSATYNQWISKHVASLATKMDAIVEANGKTMLDNSVVFWGNELSFGQHHRGECLPTVTLGSAGGLLETDLYVDYRQKPLTYVAGRTDFPAMGRSYTQLLISLMRAMGLTQNEYHSIGDGGGFGEFDRNGAYVDGRYDRYEASRNDPLPVYFRGV